MCVVIPRTPQLCRYTLTFLTRVRVFTRLPPPETFVGTPRTHVHFRSSPQKDIRYLRYIQCVSIYGLWIRYSSLFIVYGRRNPFSDGVIAEIQRRCFWLSRKRCRPLHAYAVPRARLRMGGYEVRDVRASNPLRGRRGQCNQGIPAAPLRRNNYGRGHGRYKQPADSVLPFIQGEERDIKSPYVTDWCVIRIVSLFLFQTHIHKGWFEDDDDPWQEHAKWFPNCVYVRYVMEGNEQQPDDDDADDVSMKTKKCTIL